MSSIENNSQFVKSSSIFPVKYVSLIDLWRRIDRRRRAYNKLEVGGMTIKDPKNKAGTERDHKRFVQYLHDDFLLKDISYNYENEIRAIISCIPYTEKTIIQSKNNIEEILSKHKDKYNFLNKGIKRIIKSELQTSARKSNLICKKSINIPVHDNFILEVTIDPRCSLHKQKYMEGFFQKHGICIQPSSTFGYLADRISVSQLKKISNPK